MTRRQIREQIFQILFRVEFHQKEAFEEQMGLAIEEEKTSESDILYIRKKSEDITERLEQIDQMINEKAKGWKTSRMGKVDLHE